MGIKQNFAVYLVFPICILLVLPGLVACFLAGDQLTIYSIKNLKLVPFFFKKEFFYFVEK